MKDVLNGFLKRSLCLEAWLVKTTEAGEKARPLFSIPLIRELTLVLVIKLVVIFAIKQAYFSEPLDMTQAETVIARQLGVLNPADQAQATTVRSELLLSPSETEH